MHRLLLKEEQAQAVKLMEKGESLALREFYLQACKRQSMWGGCLDAIFTKGDVHVENVKSMTFFGGKLVDVLATAPKALQARVVSAIHKGEVCSDDELPSDHMALVMKID